MKEIFILMVDSSGTSRSVDRPFAAVASEQEAINYINEGSFGYSHSYKKIKLYDTFSECKSEGE